MKRPFLPANDVPANYPTLDEVIRFYTKMKWNNGQIAEQIVDKGFHINFDAHPYVREHLLEYFARKIQSLKKRKSVPKT